MSICTDEIEDDKKERRYQYLQLMDDVDDDADDLFDIVLRLIFLVLSLVFSFCIDDFETKFLP